MPAVSRSARAHAEEVSRRRRQLTSKQRLNPIYAADSPGWEVWFALEHEEQCRHDVRDVQSGPPPPSPVVRDEDQEAEAAYQAAPAAARHESEEEERRKAEEEDAAYEAQLAEATTLSAAGDCVVPPPPKIESQPEVYQWTGCLCEWVSATPIWLGAIPHQEAAYLQHWKARSMAEEGVDGQRQMALERRLEQEAEAERLEREEEERARVALPMSPAQPAPAGQTTEAHLAPDINVVWNTTFPWVDPAPKLIDLTVLDVDNDNA
ncbi:hypothetical protein D1007_02647 [Hordeum vulgare]|nr:hypothetical protein D1007_02647 [Hordeum vulgare]